MRIGTRGTTPQTLKAQGGVRYDSAHHLEDSRGPWCAPQGVDNYIYIYIIYM
jgi:hypothetical protein